MVNQGVFLSVDFSKAYDDVFHSYLEAFFRYIALPLAMIALVISMFKVPLVFSVGRGIVPEVLLHPESGIKQGDPLSPAIFVMICPVVIPTLQKIPVIYMCCSMRVTS